jgi:hypothetical protein
MSYDINLRKDEACSETLDLSMVRSFIGSIPSITIDDHLRLTFEMDDEHYMEIYLAYFDRETSECLLDEHSFVAQGKVNCVNVHIPYGCWSNQDKIPYLRVCVQIAEQFQWEAYDLQYGKDIREIYAIKDKSKVSE